MDGLELRVLIVDDEPLARRKIRNQLSGRGDIAAIDEAGGGCEAVRRILETEPHLVFLDIQMPEMGGFDVVETVGADRMPVTIFVTAYGQYAVKAFEARALDYILKPFNPQRFEDAFRRACDLLRKDEANGFARKLTQLLESAAVGQPRLKRVAVKSGRHIYIVKTDEIEWIASAGNYTELHAGGRTHLYRETMNHLETQLDPGDFMRIHRGTMVNLNCVQSIQTCADGEDIVVLLDGTQLAMSRRYKEKMRLRFSGGD